MFKIRRCLFETNSSSADRYDDMFDDDVSDGFTAELTLSITFQTIDNIQNVLTEDKWDEFIENFIEAFNEYVKNIKNCIFYDMPEDGVELEITDDNELRIHLYDEFEFETTHYWDGEYSAATRYSPEEYPELIFELDGEPPVWLENEWNEGLEQAILKSDCGKYLTKLYAVDLDDSDFNNTFEKLNENY